jgi:hypothetical protein
MRTIDEIKNYLMLHKHDNINVEDIIKNALIIEKNYPNYEYALLCDFINSPFILEDEDEVEYLEKIKEIGGLVVYKPIYREDRYMSSSTNGDYSPSNPWNAPGMSIKDFI